MTDNHSLRTGLTEELTNDLADENAETEWVQALHDTNYSKAAIPVRSSPKMSVWMSWVPS